MRWFRVYDTLVDDPKIQRLPGDTVKALLNLWCLASQNDGMLPVIDDIAFKLRMKPAKVKELLSVLGECGLIDSDETALRPHNWNARQYKSDVADPTAASRQKAYRERNKSRNATVTNTDTRTETETDTEQSREKKPRAPALNDDWPDDHGDQFWQAYPRKTEKLATMKKLATLRKSGIVTFGDLMAGAKRYAIAVANTDPKYTKQPPTWLNAGCWADEIQTGDPNGNRNLNTQRRSASADFFAGMRSLAEDITGDDQPSGPASPEVPLGRVNIDL